MAITLKEGLGVGWQAGAAAARRGRARVRSFIFMIWMIRSDGL